MKRFSFASLGALALIAAVPFTSQLPLSASWQHNGAAIAQTQSQSSVQLQLNAAKKIVQVDKQGKQQVSWQPLQGKVVVQPGDVIRYTLAGGNNSDRPANNLVVTQPIPQQTAYLLNSVTVDHPGTIVTYSIDKGKTFVAKPIIQIKLADGKVQTQPAPAEMYTHVRWKFAQPINPKTALNAAYQVRVK